ncbi:FAD-dependent oxidoreductase [Streptomyces sp. NPDC004539]|uniref:FAD-dependent oxidoreductase n=1 Tax=Streptomyces sp. NPDC004539 TaxID=3154280 RepID=UPI0033A63921
MSGVVVIGNGPAGHRLVERLRHHGHRGQVTVLGAEPVPAYNRALLISVLDGSLGPDSLTLPRPPGDIRVRLGTVVRAIDRRRRTVYTDDGTAYPYDALVLATGARPADDSGLRTLADGGAPVPGPVAVVGGGVLGVETALALRRAGRSVTLVHPHPRPLNRLLDATAGDLLAVRLAAHGVGLRLGRRVADRQTGKLVLDDGEVVEAAGVLFCTGVVPRTRLARAAGLAVRRGVLVDDGLRTSDPYVHAVGDCAEHDGRTAAGLSAAWEQADTLAELLAGGTARYRPTPVSVRLKAPELDLAVLGPPDAAGDETVTFTDPARARHARLTLREGHVVGAQLLGMERAAAAVVQLYDRGLPVPSGRLGLLLGRAADTDTGPLELPDSTVVCVCNNVTKGALLRACREGARDLSAVTAATRAATGCGTCLPEVRRVCASRFAPEER